MGRSLCSRAMPLLSMLMVCPALTRAQTLPPAGFPVQIDSVRRVGVELTNGLISDAAVGPSGRVCLADFSNQRIACFNPDGRLLWQIGRRGAGPGEFRALYRLTLDASDTVLAFDLGSGELSVIAPDGRFIRRMPLPIRFHQVDDVIAGPNRTVVVSGVAPLAGSAADSAVHVFRLADSISYVRSFGPLPRARNRQVLEYWGAGGIRLTPDGDLIYGRKIPYEIYVYALDGRLKRKLTGPGELRYGPDDAIHIEAKAGSMRISSDTTRNIVKPLTPLPVGKDLLLDGRRARGGTVWWDAIPLSAEGKASTFTADSGQGVGALIGVDQTRHLLWAVDNEADEPSLVRLTYRMRQ